jgi:hypothetical protein
MAIGGDHGMDAGIGLSIMIVVGVSIKGFHFGTTEYLVIGEKITEAICGEVIHGITIIYIMVIFKETGEPGIIPTIGINQSTVSLRITMMEDCMVVGMGNLERALKESLKKVGKGNLEQALKGSLKKVGMVLQEPKYTLRANTRKVKPKANIPKKQKERNEV